MSLRACDSCRIRKVKCDKGQPCGQCAHFGLPCTIGSSAIKRNNPVRGRLIAQARGGNTDSGGELGAWKARQIGSHVMVPTFSVEKALAKKMGAALCPSPSSDLLATDFKRDFFLQLLPEYERLVYPFNPVISPDDMCNSITAMDDNVEDQALVFAFASTTIFLAQRSDLHFRGTVMTQMEELMQHSLEAHQRMNLQQAIGSHMAEGPTVTIKRIVTCIFLEISAMAFNCYHRSFTLLREAIAMLQILQANSTILGSLSSSDSSLYANLDVARYQRLYWQAFIHERFLTIAAGYPSILTPLSTSHLVPDLRVPAHIKLGFDRLIRLFLVMDQQFLTYWGNLQQQTRPHWKPHLQMDSSSLIDIQVEWVEAKQAELDADERSAFEASEQLKASGRGTLTELQHADLFVTRLWLRTLVWQLALSRGLLRSSPPQNVHEGLSLQFPAQRLSTQLRLLVSQLESVASIGMQGSGIVQKLFEITSTIADVLTLPLVDHSTEEDNSSGDDDAHVEDFIFLVQFISQFERIRDQQKAYLWDKVDVLRAKHGWQKDLEA